MDLSCGFVPAKGACSEVNFPLFVIFPPLSLPLVQCLCPFVSPPLFLSPLLFSTFV